jgi:hypothetical protein
MSGSLARRPTVISSNPAASATVTMGSRITALRFDNFRRHYDGPDEKWRVGVVDKLVELTSLPPDCDGYGGQPVKWDAGMFALNVLKQVMLPRTSLPQIVPSSIGGLQIEWHEKDIDLEFHVNAPYEGELWFEDRRADVIVSMLISDDLSQLQSAVHTLTQR